MTEPIHFSGNHESVTMNQMYGFDGEVKSKYPFNWKFCEIAGNTRSL